MGAKGPILTESNIKFLRALMGGKYLKGTVGNERQRELVAEIGSVEPSTVLRKLERMGIVAGYVPVLSEEGAKVLRAMEAMYGMSKSGQVDHERPLTELVE